MITGNCFCGQLLFFENTVCVNCSREVGFLQDSISISSLDPTSDGAFQATASSAKRGTHRKCVNYTQKNVCNWMIPVENPDEFCTSCRLDTVIPDLSVPRNVELWAITEAAKRRLIYSCLRLKLPLASRVDEPQIGLGFRLLSDVIAPDGSVSPVLTAHDNGLITLNIKEADDGEREKIRLGMKEPYRTLLGHFRHESGHYYWDRLVQNTQFLEPFRKLFGDERSSYDEALNKYYSAGAPSNWQDQYVSAYSTMHPWEDWAETWAHFLHIHDTLEVAVDFALVGKKIRLDPTNANDGQPPPKPFDQVLEKWSELTVGLNCINRSMGLRDLYPFVLSQPVIEKLHFVSEVIKGTQN